jgi:hypothetical protein
VSGGRLGGAIGFYENETRGIILLLKHVKARNAGFLDAGARVGERRLLEGLNVIGLQVDMNMDDKHGVESLNR